MNDVRNDVRGILQFLDYETVRDEETGRWTPVGALDGRFGSTDVTKLVRDTKEPNLLNLIDCRSGMHVATAKLPTPHEVKQE